MSVGEIQKVRDGIVYRYRILPVEGGFRVYSLDLGRYVLGKYTHYVIANDHLNRWFKRWSKQG